MRIAIMQPYFFPYLGYFDLLYNVDLFIAYDTVQYIKQGWIHRNRILHRNKQDWQYISVPLNRASFHNSYQTPIVDVRITNNKPWRQHIVGQLAHYEKTASHPGNAIDFVGNCLNVDEDSISQLNMYILEKCVKLLGFNLQYRFCSELAIQLDKTRTPEERVLDLCEFLGAKEYVNLPGGVQLYHTEAFASRNIKLTFRNLPTFVYPTEPYAFQPNLSIIDLLMWNEPDNIKRYLWENRS